MGYVGQILIKVETSFFRGFIQLPFWCPLGSNLSKHAGRHWVTTESCAWLAQVCVVWRSGSSLELSALCIKVATQTHITIGWLYKHLNSDSNAMQLVNYSGIIKINMLTIYDTFVENIVDKDNKTKTNCKKWLYKGIFDIIITHTQPSWGSILHKAPMIWIKSPLLKLCITHIFSKHTYIVIVTIISFKWVSEIRTLMAKDNKDKVPNRKYKNYVYMKMLVQEYLKK